ncbi:hypothetical protein GDO78_006199 [Eleutherodactylus coqui]|uniref:Uncharacterized protein n=1 Tax=Eleutherodactylus coqui TaxID=57060 RepID=A0A8J6FMY9_ELECQ|nr:hypothetical protein GDO78_006199 [Eleutherodactylus coqui]
MVENHNPLRILQQVMLFGLCKVSETMSCNMIYTSTSTCWEESRQCIQHHKICKWQDRQTRWKAVPYVTGTTCRKILTQYRGFLWKMTNKLET